MYANFDPDRYRSPGPDQPLSSTVIALYINADKPPHKRLYQDRRPGSNRCEIAVVRLSRSCRRATVRFAKENRDTFTAASSTLLVMSRFMCSMFAAVWLIAAGFASAATWLPVIDTDDSAIFVDAASVQRNGPRVSAWFLWDHSLAKTLAGPAQQSYRSMKSRDIYDSTIVRRNSARSPRRSITAARTASARSLVAHFSRHVKLFLKTWCRTASATS